MTLSVIPDALVQRVTAHLEQFGTLARPALWTGKGSVVAHFTTDLHVVSMDTRFTPLTVNWTMTFRSPDGAIYLNVPAAWRKVDREAEEGEANTMPMYLSLSEPQQTAIRDIAGGDVYAEQRQGTLKALVADGWISGTQEGGRILPPFALTPAGETMLFEYDVMRLHKAAEFKIGQAVQYLKWGASGESHAFEWVNATVTNVGMVMLTLDYEDGTRGQRRANSVRVKPALAAASAPNADPGILPSRPTAAFRPISKHSPLRDQYLSLKADYPDHLMFFRLGDFYELFDADAETAARELDLVLTKRPTGNGKETVPMCGVPYHALDLYVERVRKAGYAVAVVEQVSEPNGRGLVERRVERTLDALPILDPTAPIPANEIENADEPHDDIGTGVDPEPANNLPDVQPDPYEWFTVGDRAVRKSDNAEIVITDVDGDFISGTGALYGEVEVGLIRSGNGTYIKAKDYAHTPVTVTRAHRKHFCRPLTGEWSAATPEPEQSADPIYQDYIGTLLRVNDWVQTPAGLKGAIVGFKQDRMAVVALMSEFKSFDSSTDIHDYLAHTLRRIDPPTPPNDPIDYEAYNGGLADAALAALEQADIERAEKTDPYAWATAAKRDALNALLDRKHVYPQIIEPSTTEDVWRMEDEWKVKTMQRTLDKIGGALVGTLEQDWNGDEPYCVALFRLEVDDRPDYTPFPSKRQTKPAADPNSIHAQYDALHSTLPAATQLLIQANGDEWLAFQMDAMLLRRYAPLCRFSPQTVNQAGEQWDKLSIPAGMLDETVTNANEGGLTVALASIVRDEPGKLPVREVTEIHSPNEPVQYVGKEEPPTEWETESDAEDAAPQSWTPDILKRVRIKSGLHAGIISQVTDIGANARGTTYKVFSEWYNASDLEDPNTPMVSQSPSKIEMTPALMAAKIRLHIHGALRLGLIESVTPMPHDGWFAVTFVHGLTEAFTVPALKTVYEVGDVWRSKRTVYVREQSTTPHGTAIEQAAAVLENLSSIGEVFADAKARMEAFTAPDPDPTTVLLDHDAGADLIATLRTEHADLSEASLGITEFLLNVIARMRTVEAARVY